MGPPGPKGETGSPGANGAPGMSGLEVVKAQTAADTVAQKTVTASCPPGKRAIAGGGRIRPGGQLRVALVASFPAGAPPTAWVAEAEEVRPFASDWTLEAFAVCAYVG